MTTTFQDRMEARGRTLERHARLADAERLVDPLTDTGNSERFLELYGDDVRYIGPWEQWLFWDGRRWTRDTTNHVEKLLLDSALQYAARTSAELREAYLHIADDQENLDLRKRIKALKEQHEFAVQSQNARPLRNAGFISRSAPNIGIHHDALDQDPWLMNVRNGTIDLRSGDLLPHSPTDLITKLTDVDYDRDARCPTWDAFLLGAMGGDEELVGYLQRYMGYCLSGVIREHALAFFFGSGANGKSTFLNVMRDVMGDYGTAAPRGLLFRHAHEQHPSELATLCGVRFAVCAEVDEGQAFDEGKLKDLTGGDPISTRRMRQDFWEFRPTHKLVLAGNHRPVVRGDDMGIWRRIKLIPWTVTIPEADRDTQLGAKLRAELGGILAWAVRGCLAWQERGLGEPAAVVDATQSYRVESDYLGQFLDANCHFEGEGRISKKALREAYEIWCRDQGALPVGARKVADQLRRRGAVETRVRTSEGVRDGWANVRLKHDAEMLPMRLLNGTGE